MSDDLNRQIAEALGWRDVRPHPRTGELIGIDPDVEVSDADRWPYVDVPPWDCDAEAALALCQELAQRFHLTVDITVYSDGGIGVCALERDIRDEAHGKATPAETLARWALNALRELAE